MTLPSAAILRPKPTGACKMDRLTKVPFRDNLTTGGDGYWSEAIVTVLVTHLQVPYINKKETFGELCVYFNINTWRVERHGLIYTDQNWLNELCDALGERGYDTSDVGYSEHGAQGDDFVSLDVGEKFLASWIKINCPVEA